MVNNIEELCDDVISHILSFLSIRDGFRARVSSRRWLCLPDTRSSVKLDSQNVFGKELIYAYRGDNPALQSKFVKIVDHFMDIWAGKRMRTLIINFVVGKQHYRDVTRWIAKAVRMEVEDIYICVSSSSAEKYLFPCTLIQHESAPYLKQLCLRVCTLSSLNFGWLSNLTTLELFSTPMDRTGMDLILSAGTNLISLKLYWCDLPKYVWIDGQLLRLKKLYITGSELIELKLNCPSLEVFQYHGPVASMSFVHVPVLREAKLWFPYHLYACSLMFNHVDIQAPRLQALNLMIKTEVISYPPKLARFSLKELEIQVTRGFDLLSVSNLLNACPCLEILRVGMKDDNNTNPTIGRGEYRDQSHYKLKQVKIVRFDEQWNAMEFAKYVLTNAVALEQMLILTRRHIYLRDKFESLQLLLHKEINPTAQVIISNRFYRPN